MTTKKSIMSLSIEPALQDYIKREAKQDGISASKLICNLVQKYLVDRDKMTIIEHNDEQIPVVLKVPANLRGTEQVKSWLASRMLALGDRLSQNDNTAG